MTWRYALAAILASVVTIGGLVTIYATPLGAPPPPSTCACPEIVTVSRVVIRPALPYSQAATMFPAAGTTPADSVTLTVADQGSTVLLLVGDTIDIDLSALSGPFTVGDAVLRPVMADGGPPGSSSAEAAFRAVKAGNTSIVATVDGFCAPTMPSCPHPATMWRVTVVVH